MHCKPFYFGAICILVMSVLLFPGVCNRMVAMFAIYTYMHVYRDVSLYAFRVVNT